MGWQLYRDAFKRLQYFNLLGAASPWPHDPYLFAHCTLGFQGYRLHLVSQPERLDRIGE
jgi:hypothetical protein